MAKLEIIRKKSIWGCAIKVHIDIDESEKFDLSNNEAKEVDLTKGEHTIKYKVWNRRSKTVVINAQDGKEYKILFKYDPLWGGFKLDKKSIID